MFGKNAAKQQQQIAQQNQAQQTQFIQAAAQPTELQKRYEQSQLDFLDWEGGKDAPPDVTNAPGMAPYLDLYNHAKAGQEGERQGQGLVSMGLNASEPGLLAKLAEQSKARREQDAAGGLENALKLRSAEAHGSVLPLTSLNQNRTMGLASLASGNSNAGWARYLDQMNRSGFTNSNLFNQMMENARRGAAAGAGG
jgi:hypothetical protein